MTRGILARLLLCSSPTTQHTPYPIQNSTAVQEQLAAARDGLLDVLPLSAVQALSPSELRAAICGAGQEADPLALHPDRWAEHIELEGYRSDSPQVRLASSQYDKRAASCVSHLHNDTHTHTQQILWLWEFLGAASLETRARLLRFITGSSRLPAPVSW